MVRNNDRQRRGSVPAYYNEFDPYAAQWLRNLIAENLIPKGDVDERSIIDVQPGDLAGYVQCHFFAGIAGWSLAARLAGWPDDRELWTGSAPCQPFSVAGAQRGTDDDRHLWPHFFRLIRARRPAVVMGEQVAAAVGAHWLDGVCADLEGVGYTCGATVVPACAVDAPHRRDRLWFVADSQCNRGGCEVEASDNVGPKSNGSADRAGGRGDSRICAMADADIARSSEKRQQRSRQLGGAGGDPGACDGVLADSDSKRGKIDTNARGREAGGGAREVAGPCSAWDGAGWIIGHDGKARRVEPGIRLLAHGIPARVGRLRAYGNAIVPSLAAEIIGAYLDCQP
jgi:DNA (cytosine-5)-methyltransferase 1